MHGRKSRDAGNRVKDEAAVALLSADGRGLGVAPGGAPVAAALPLLDEG